MNERIPKLIQDALTEEYKLWKLSEIDPNRVPERQTGVTWHVLIATPKAYILGDVSRMSSSSLFVEHIKKNKQGKQYLARVKWRIPNHVIKAYEQRNR